MAVRVNNIILPLDASLEDVRERAVAALHGTGGEVLSFRVAKQSVDARHGVRFLYGAELTLSDEAHVRENANVRRVDYAREPLMRGTEPMQHRPVVVGTGPAGLFAGLTLARQGYAPLLLERGSDVDRRMQRVAAFWQGGPLDPGTNVQFGEGGAGTFSDGKLTTRTSDPRQRDILADFHRFGAPDEILYKAKPHIGTDILKTVVKRMREEIVRLGGEVRFETALTGLVIRDGCLAGIALSDGSSIPCDALVLAIGHSARDTYQMLLESGVHIAQKAFSIGARIEHRQADIDAARYGRYAGHPALGAADYQLSCRVNGRACYSFCMCPGGRVVASASVPETVVTNGMSEFARSEENANAALCVAVDGRDFGSSHPLAGVWFQERWERLAFEAGGRTYAAPVQRVGDFLDGRPSRKPGRIRPSYTGAVTPSDLHLCLPDFATDALAAGIRQFGRRIRGFAAPDALLTGVETRTSAPVRILREEDGQACGIAGLYPAGEGAGYAGGIMSAAVDGIKAAEHVMARYAPVRE